MKKIIKVFAIIGSIIATQKSNAQCNVDAGPDLSICCPGGSVIIGVSASATICSCTNYAYQWTPTVGLSSPNNLTTTASPSSTTVYTLCMTAYKKNGCAIFCCQACDVVTVTVNNSCCRLVHPGSATGKYAASINIFPNPAQTSLNVEMGISLVNGSIQIFDVNGKMVWQKKEVTEKNKLSIDVSTLPRGIYFLKAYDQNAEVYNNRIVLE
jgi:hypothetical protein